MVGAEDRVVVSATRLMERVNERSEPWRHDEQVPSGLSGPGVAIRVRSALRRQDGTTRTGPDPKSQSPIEHVPRLIIGVVDVQRRNPIPLTVAWIGPLDEHEVGALSADLPARERGHKRVAWHREPAALRPSPNVILASMKDRPDRDEQGQQQHERTEPKTDAEGRGAGSEREGQQRTGGQRDPDGSESQHRGDKPQPEECDHLDPVVQHGREPVRLDDRQPSADE
jgi:hypothetical protein